jgi:adenine deaminase
MFATDDRHPSDLMEEGHIDYMVRTAISLGLDPMVAIQMATLNASEYFGFSDKGAVAPGRRADLVVVDDLRDFHAGMVFRGGELVASDGRMVNREQSRSTITLRSSMNVAPISVDDFRIESKGKRARIIGVVSGQIVTEQLLEEPMVRDGLVVADVERDVIKLAVVERHLASGNIGCGLVRGLGLNWGAMASSVAHDSHNIIVAGVSDEDMLAAVEEVVRMRGGLVAVGGGKVLARLPLPIAGLMSDRSAEEVNGAMRGLVQATSEMGCTLDDPFMTLSFLALPVIPTLKLTDKGLVNVMQFKLVPLFVD